MQATIKILNQTIRQKKELLHSLRCERESLIALLCDSQAKIASTQGSMYELEYELQKLQPGINTQDNQKCDNGPLTAAFNGADTCKNTKR